MKRITKSFQDVLFRVIISNQMCHLFELIIIGFLFLQPTTMYLDYDSSILTPCSNEGHLALDSDSYETFPLHITPKSFYWDFWQSNPITNIRPELNLVLGSINKNSESLKPKINYTFSNSNVDNTSTKSDVYVDIVAVFSAKKISSSNNLDLTNTTLNDLESNSSVLLAEKVFTLHINFGQKTIDMEILREDFSLHFGRQDIFIYFFPLIDKISIPQIIIQDVQAFYVTPEFNLKFALSALTFIVALLYFFYLLGKLYQQHRSKNKKPSTQKTHISFFEERRRKILKLENKTSSSIILELIGRLGRIYFLIGFIFQGCFLITALEINENDLLDLLRILKNASEFRNLITILLIYGIMFFLFYYIFAVYSLYNDLYTPTRTVIFSLPYSITQYINNKSIISYYHILKYFGIAMLGFLIAPFLAPQYLIPTHIIVYVIIIGLLSFGFLFTFMVWNGILQVLTIYTNFKFDFTHNMFLFLGSLVSSVASMIVLSRIDKTIHEASFLGLFSLPLMLFPGGNLIYLTVLLNASIGEFSSFLLGSLLGIATLFFFWEYHIKSDIIKYLFEKYQLNRHNYMD